MTKKVLVPIADGTEEIEAVCIINVLRRAGAEVVVASVGKKEVACSRGVMIVADKLIADCLAESFDLIVLPGGVPGAQNLRDSTALTELLKKQAGAGGFFGAICASPAVVLQAHGLLENRRATTHPGFTDQLEPNVSIENRVVVDGNCITSRGPGTALEFALKLVEMLYGPEKARKVGEPMVLP
ncbi:MAG: DJ-1 family protein [Desulfobacterales bacterium]|nr:DJ-1 family protein [Desulfobacterales bacterium]